MKFLRRWLLRASIPIQKTLQKMHPPETLIDANFVADVRGDVDIGDIFLTRQRMHFTNLFIPGFWSHAAMYDGTEVCEAIGNGVQFVALEEFLYKKDWVLHLRPAFSINKPIVRQFLALQSGKPYDFEFASGVKAWYCSELIHVALKMGNKRAPFNLRHTFGVPTVTPQDFENAVARGKFIVATDSRRY